MQYLDSYNAQQWGLMNKAIILTIFAILVSTMDTASAAQCKFLSNNQAEQAQEVLMGNTAIASMNVVDYYCESCMDKYPKPIVLDDIKIVRNIIGEKSVIMINNKSVDLAYLYVNGVNLASEVSCETYAVSTYLD